MTTSREGRLRGRDLALAVGAAALLLVVVLAASIRHDAHCERGGEEDAEAAASLARQALAARLLSAEQEALENQLLVKRVAGLVAEERVEAASFSELYGDADLLARAVDAAAAAARSSLNAASTARARRSASLYKSENDAASTRSSPTSPATRFTNNWFSKASCSALKSRAASACRAREAAASASSSPPLSQCASWRIDAANTTTNNSAAAPTARARSRPRRRPSRVAMRQRCEGWPRELHRAP